MCWDEIFENFIFLGIWFLDISSHFLCQGAESCNSQKRRLAKISNRQWKLLVNLTDRIGSQLYAGCLFFRLLFVANLVGRITNFTQILGWPIWPNNVQLAKRTNQKKRTDAKLRSGLRARQEADKNLDNLVQCQECSWRNYRYPKNFWRFSWCVINCDKW